MSYNRSPLAFDDIREVFDKALNSNKGLRISCVNRGAAFVLRSRFNYFRTIDRRESAKIYPTDHPMWAKSAYDKLVLRIPAKGTDEENILYIEKRRADKLRFEEIVEELD